MNRSTDVISMGTTPVAWRMFCASLAKVGEGNGLWNVVLVPPGAKGRLRWSQR